VLLAAILEWLGPHHAYDVQAHLSLGSKRPNWGFHLWNAEKQAAKWVAFTKQGFVCHYLGQPLKELSKAWVRLCKSVLPSCIYLLAAVHCRRQSLRQR